MFFFVPILRFLKLHLYEAMVLPDFARARQGTVGDSSTWQVQGFEGQYEIRVLTCG